jgi:hypothetical protein
VQFHVQAQRFGLRHRQAQRLGHGGPVKLIFLGALIAFLSGFQPARAVELVPRTLDLDFASAVESWVAQLRPEMSTGPCDQLISQLDADRYTDREKAGSTLLALCAADPNCERWLFRLRAVERRPEVRYWLNRILRRLERCETCDGFGYCPEYRPVDTTPNRPEYWGIPCVRCRRLEWQHGECWTESGYGRLACEACEGRGTYWNHFAVD